MTHTPIADNPLANLLPGEQPTDSWRWGTVTTTSPLTIRLDGDEQALVQSPDTLAPVTESDRVRVHIYNRRATIMGVAGGMPENCLWIAGHWYQASGVQDLPSYKWVTTGDGWYATTIHMPAPYQPPQGYGFAYSMLEGNGFTIITTATPTKTIAGVCETDIRLLNYHHISPLISRIQWQLVQQTYPPHNT